MRERRSAADSAVDHGDTIVNFDASRDNFTFTGANAATAIHYVDTAAFDGSVGSPRPEARVDQSGGNATLQIDVNGDGLMDSNDIDIHLTSYTGTLHDQNFMLAWEIAGRRRYRQNQPRHESTRWKTPVQAPCALKRLEIVRD